MRTFLRRWAVTNSLYFFNSRTGSNWTEDSDFIDWVLGIEIKQKPDYWYRNSPSRTWVQKFLLNSLLISKENYDSRRVELLHLVEECIDEDVNFIEKREVSFGKRYGNQITVSVRGLEVYSLSYLFFGHYYARTIWTGLIIALVAAFVSCVLQDNCPVFK